MNIGIAGCGLVAREHMRALEKLETARVVALCDSNERALAATSKEWSISSCYTDYEKMLDCEQLDVVSILTPPQSHRILAVQAIRRNVNVLVEKPLTTSMAEADLILESLRSSEAKLMVEYVMLFSRIMSRASDLMKKGLIGEILGAEISFLCTKDDPMASNEKHWCHKMPGGRLGEMLPHPIYVLQSILGNELEVERVTSAKRGNYPWMHKDELKVLLRGSKGWGDIYASFNAARPAIFVDVYGTRKILRADLINHTLVKLGPRGLSKVDSARDSLRQSGRLFFSTMMNAMGFLRTARMENSLRNVYASFLNSIETNTRPVVTPEFARETVRTAEQICKWI